VVGLAVHGSATNDIPRRRAPLFVAFSVGAIVTPWVLIGGIALALALPITWRVAGRRFDPFEPIVLFVLAYGTMFVARPATMLVNHEFVFWDLDTRPELSRALLIALVGAVGFVAAYETAVGSALAARLPTPGPVDTRRATGLALGIAALGLVALLVFLPLSEPGTSLKVLLGGRSDELGALLDDTSTYLWYGSLLLAPAALTLVALAIRDRNLWIGAAGGVVLALALARVVPIGGRIVLLPLLGGLFVLVYVMRDRRPRVVLLAGLAAVALLGSFFSLHFRDPNDPSTLRTAVDDLRKRPQVVLDPVLRGPDGEMVLALSGALTVIPDPLGYRWGGATVGNLAIRPIPRELWSEKPRPPGETVVATVWPELYPSLDPAFSPLLVLYWDFGAAGVLLGMALFGIAARLLYEWFLLHRRRLGAQLLFASGIWFVVIGARNDPVDTIVFGVFLLAPIAAIVALARQPAPLRTDLRPETATGSTRTAREPRLATRTQDRL